MSSLRKIQKLDREAKSLFGKAPDKLNLIIAIRIERELIKKFKDQLTCIYPIKYLNEPSLSYKYI